MLEMKKKKKKKKKTAEGGREAVEMVAMGKGTN